MNIMRLRFTCHFFNLWPHIFQSCSICSTGCYILYICSRSTHFVYIRFVCPIWVVALCLSFGEILQTSPFPLFLPLADGDNNDLTLALLCIRKMNLPCPSHQLWYHEKEENLCWIFFCMHPLCDLVTGCILYYLIDFVH